MFRFVDRLHLFFGGTQKPPGNGFARPDLSDREWREQRSWGILLASAKGKNPREQEVTRSSSRTRTRVTRHFIRIHLGLHPAGHCGNLCPDSRDTEFRTRILDKYAAPRQRLEESPFVCFSDKFDPRHRLSNISRITPTAGSGRGETSRSDFCFPDAFHSIDRYASQARRAGHLPRYPTKASTDEANHFQTRKSKGKSRGR